MCCNNPPNNNHCTVQRHVSDFLEFVIEHREKVFDLEKDGYKSIVR